MRIFGFFVAAAALAVICAAQIDGPLGATAQGQVAGEALKAGGAVFRAIPFAQPPLGDLRWREPLPPKSWSGTRDARAYSAPCAQIDANWNTVAAKTGSEDCLYLNVWSPEWPSRAAKPVMVWFYGGGNTGGSFLGEGGIEPSFDGERLSQHGVVVVTISYRLGLLGFIAHPELTEESPHHASGNYGLMDQIAALKWVRENIARFGGDSNNVTIFGQSAGAHDIGLLMASPQARDLFQKAIGESGSVVIRAGLTRARQDLEQAGVRLAVRLGAPAKGQVKFMRGLSATEIFKAAPGYNDRNADRPEPDIDGYVITKQPAAMFRAGEDAAVPLIIGNNARERTASDLTKEIQEFYGALSPKALKLYESAPTDYAPWGQARAQFATDIQFRCSASTIALWHSAKSPTFQYEFTRAPEPLGAVHSWELQYVFGNLKQATEEADRKLSDEVRTYWTNFAKAGNPNGAGVPAWPKFGSEREYMDLGSPAPVAKGALHEAFCDVWREKLTNSLGGR
jgi:para-nitrobenzyl esterase